MPPAVKPSSLQQWRDRAGKLPSVMVAALDASAPHSLPEAECCDVLDLLELLGCDAQTQAAALWFELARVAPEVWKAQSATLPAELKRLV